MRRSWGLCWGSWPCRSRSIVPGIVFHFINNALAVALGSVVHAPWAAGIVPWIYRNPDEGLYHRQWIVAERAALGSLAVLFVEVEADRSRPAGRERKRVCRTGVLIRARSFTSEEITQG